MKLAGFLHKKVQQLLSSKLDISPKKGQQSSWTNLLVAMSNILDLGCGKNKWPGAIGIDFANFPDIDIKWNLDHYPYPIKDDSFDKIILHHSIEHLENPERTLKEVFRIGKNGCIVEIVSPHYSSLNAYADLNHRHLISMHSFDAYCGYGSSYIEADMRFKILERRVSFWRLHDKIKFVPYKVLGISLIANKFPAFYERFLTFLFPAKETQIVLEVVK